MSRPPPRPPPRPRGSPPSKPGCPAPVARPALPGVIATTRRSAPVPRIGTQPLADQPLGVLPSTNDRGPQPLHWPSASAGRQVRTFHTRARTKLAPPSCRTPAALTARLFRRRSAPRLLTGAPRGGLRPPPRRATAEDHQPREASPSISDTAPHQLIRASTSTLPLHSCSHTKPRSTSPSSNGKSSPPTTSPTSTPSNNSYSPSADATNRSPRPSNGSSPTTISTPGSNGSPNAR